MRHLPGKAIIDLDFTKPYNEISNNQLLQLNKHSSH